jgi:hypothetical protein
MGSVRRQYLVGRADRDRQSGVVNNVTRSAG